MHLAMHCPAALLWDTLSGQNNDRKRTHFQMVNESTTDTFANMSKRFNLVPEQLPITTRNPLMSQPSLAALAATREDQNNLSCLFQIQEASVEFNNRANELPLTPPAVAPAVTNCTAMSRCPSKRNTIRLPPDIAFQVHLATVLLRHRGNDLNMFSEITDCVSSHALHHGVDFSTMHTLSREQLVKQLTNTYQLQFLRPTIHYVTLSDNTLASVPIYDVKAQLIAFLNDPLRMKPEHFASNYDIFSGKPTSPVTDLNEIHTGSAWEEARSHYIGEHSDAFPLGLVGFYDKTHTDVFGSLACSPFIVTPAFLNCNARNNDKNYMVLGYIPNLGMAKGKAKTQSATERLQDEHDCLRLITNQITKIHNEGGFWTMVMGRRVRVIVWIHFIAGDTSGHNNLVGHMNGGRPKYIYRDCYCKHKHMSRPTPKCQLITIADIAQARLTDDGLTLISKKKIRNAFDNVPLSDLEHGIFGVVPAEMLHVSGTGLLKYIFKCLCNLIGTEKKNKHEKEAFDDLHRCLVGDAQRQSEKQMPRMSIRNGITDGTKMCGSERVGNCFILLCAIYTKQGSTLLAPGLARKTIRLKDIRNCIKLYLAFEQWVNESHSIQEVIDGRGLLAHLIRLIKRCFPKDWGWGWNLPKMHSLARMIDYMLKFGIAKNFSGQTGERALKSIVKDHAQQTQRRADKFTEQCAMREYEENVITYVYDDIASQLGQNHAKKHNHTELCKVEGEYTAHLGHQDIQGRSQVKIQWKNTKRNKIQIGVSEVLTYCVRKFAHRHGFRKDFMVTGYTTLKMYSDENSEESVRYHANEYMHGESRYDYAMVKFLCDDNSINTAPAKIMGFLRYDRTPGVPTPHLSDSLKQSLEELEATNARDDQLYVVIHASSTYLSFDDLEEKFISKFILGDVNQCMYIVKVDDILGPLFVFRNYGGKNEDANHLFCALPQRKWSHYFSNKIATHRLP